MFTLLIGVVHSFMSLKTSVRTYIYRSPESRKLNDKRKRNSIIKRSKVKQEEYTGTKSCKYAD